MTVAVVSVAVILIAAVIVIVVVTAAVVPFETRPREEQKKMNSQIKIHCFLFSSHYHHYYPS